MSTTSADHGEFLQGIRLRSVSLPEGVPYRPEGLAIGQGFTPLVLSQDIDLVNLLRQRRRLLGDSGRVVVAYRELWTAQHPRVWSGLSCSKSCREVCELEED